MKSLSLYSNSSSGKSQKCSIAGFLVLVLLMLFSFSGKAQSNPDLNLITLQNGSQHLGYIIEQRPGESISIYRPELNDTVIVALEDIKIITRLLVTEPADSVTMPPRKVVLPGKYNNRKNVFQFGIQGMLFTHKDNGGFYNSGLCSGLQLSYMRSFQNKYFVGFTYSRLNNFEYIDVGLAFERRMFLIQGKIRLSKKPQTSRLCVLWMLEVGHTTEKSTILINRVRYEYENSLILQSFFSFKLNTDTHSGFCYEFGAMVHRPTIRRLNNSNGIVGREKKLFAYPSVRINYFF